MKVDGERAKYLDMFVGFLDGTLAPGGMLGEPDGCGLIRSSARPIPTIRSRAARMPPKIHATRTSKTRQSRRQHQRVDLRMSAEVRTTRTVFTATTRDLSEGGAGLSADRPLEEGEEVVLGLFLVVDDVESDTPPLWVKARVAWCAETRRQPLQRRRPVRGDHRRPARLAAPGAARPIAPRELSSYGATSAQRRGSARRRGRRRARR